MFESECTLLPIVQFTLKLRRFLLESLNFGGRLLLVFLVFEPCCVQLRKNLRKSRRQVLQLRDALFNLCSRLGLLGFEEVADHPSKVVNAGFVRVVLLAECFIGLLHLFELAGQLADMTVALLGFTHAVAKVCLDQFVLLGESLALLLATVELR